MAGTKAVFRSVFPIGATDTDALPVAEIGTAVEFYQRNLGFAPVRQDAATAVLERDGVRIGLAVNGADPEQASCGFPVSDVAALRQELLGTDLDVGTLGEQEWNGTRYRVFFAKEPYGVCFCFTQPA